MSGADGAPAPGAEKADAAAWLAVAAGTIGALMATLDTSIVNSALPTIQGEIGASGAEGTWISTAYLVAEIVMIPLAGWLERIFGLRSFLLIATTAFTLFSMWCGIAQDLPHMVIGRIGQGFFGGAMIPTALTIVGTRLPPAQRPLGIALFGMTAVLGPVLGPVLGGWLTENISWHYAFFMNLPIGIGLLGMVTVGLPGRKAKFDEFLSTDVEPEREVVRHIAKDAPGPRRPGPFLQSWTRYGPPRSFISAASSYRAPIHSAIFGDPSPAGQHRSRARAGRRLA